MADIEGMRILARMFATLNSLSQKRRMRNTQKKRSRRMWRPRNSVIPQVIIEILRQNGMELVRRPGKPMHNAGYWETVVPSMVEAKFHREFRMRRETFRLICSRVKPFMEKQDTALHQAIALDKRVAIAISVLKSAGKLRVVGTEFGVSKTAVHEILWEFVDAICNHLFNEDVYLPRDRAEAEEIAQEFKTRSGFPGCIGALDCTYIEISPPREAGSKYMCYKGFNSVVLLVLADDRYQIRYVNVGRPGSMEDAAVLRSSALFGLGMNGTLTYGEDYHIIGDKAFPLLPWLMKPFPVLDVMKKHHEEYNKILNSSLAVTENVFKRLSHRWRILSRRLEYNVENAHLLVMTCIWLHNICESQNEKVLDAWVEIDRRLQLEQAFPRPPPQHRDRHRPRELYEKALDKREHLAQQLLHKT